jgi:hypothetical protein
MAHTTDSQFNVQWDVLQNSDNALLDPLSDIMNNSDNNEPAVLPSRSVNVLSPTF